MRRYKISMGSSFLPLIVLVFSSLLKHMVPDDVPGIVNANEEQEECCSAHDEQGWACMGVSRECRCAQHYVCREWEQNMKQPVLEDGLVDGLQSQTPSHEDDVHDPTEAQYPPENCEGVDAVP